MPDEQPKKRGRGKTKKKALSPLPTGFSCKRPPERVKTLVRCLGPKAKEHYFLSDDPAGHRRCDDCDRLVLGLSLRQANAPARVVLDDSTKASDI